MASIFPLLAKNVYKDMAKFNAIFYKSIIIAIISAIFIILIFMGNSKFIINFLGGPTFQQSYYSLLFLLLSCPLFFINNIFFHIFLINNKTHKLILLIILSLIFNIIINFIIIPKFGYIGASFTTGVTELFMLIEYLIFLKPLKFIKERKL